MDTVTTGIDGMNLTFPGSVSLESIIERLFTGIDLDMFEHGPSPYKFYRECYTLKSVLGTKLLQLHVHPTSFFGKRNLLQIHGLCFSGSALNALRPLDIGRLIFWALLYGAHVSKFDVYLDDFTGAVSQKHLNEISQPHTFQDYIQSPFLKTRDGEKPEPRHFKGTWYFGQPKHNACEITTYDKGRSPRQKVHSKLNPLKFTWQRYELRFSGDTAKRLGGKLLKDLRHGANLNTCITQLFRSYLRFVEPNHSNKRVSSWPLQSWWSKLLDMADQLPPVTFDCGPRYAWEEKPSL